MPPAFLADAAETLRDERCDLVVRPSDDGGYYLVGARTVHLELFADMTWSVATVFEETMRRAAWLGLAVHVLPAWYDVDDAASLAIARAELFEGRAFAPGGPTARAATATRRCRAELPTLPGV